MTVTNKQQSRYKGRITLPYHDSTGNILGYLTKVPGNNITYIYNQNGQLIELGFDITNIKPDRYYRYKYPSGELFELVLYTTDDEMFKFSPDGNLNGHWINGKCYDENGNIIAAKTKTTNPNITVIATNNQDSQNNNRIIPPVAGTSNNFWTVEKAKQALFNNIKQQLTLTSLPSKDPYTYDDYVNKGCFINSFDSGYYQIHCFEKNNFDKILTYNQAHNIEAVDFIIYPEKFLKTIEKVGFGEKLKDIDDDYPQKRYS